MRGKHENNRKSRRCRYKEINILQFIGILLSTGAHIYMHERMKADQLQVVLLAPPMKISSYKPHLKPKTYSLVLSPPETKVCVIFPLLVLKQTIFVLQ